MNIGSKRWQCAAVFRWVLLTLLILCIPGCAHIDTFSEKSWAINEFTIDGLFRIDLKLPTTTSKTEGLVDQFIVTQEGQANRLFTASYDRGYGDVSYLSYTRISGVVFPFTENENYDDVITSEEIKSTIFLTRDDAKDRFVFDGDHDYSGLTWLKVKRILDSSRGISFLTPIHDRYVLMLSMTIYDIDSEQSELYQLREQTLIQVLNSVQLVRFDSVE